MSPSRTLSERPKLQNLRKQAKLLRKGFCANEEGAAAEVNAHYRNAKTSAFRLSDAQLVLARSYGFSSWPKLVAHVYSLQGTDEPARAHYKEVFQAAREGDLAKISALIDRDETIIDISDSNQSTPLTVAFAYQHLELAEFLISQGANVFAMNHSDKWAMRTIVEKGGLKEEDRKRLTESAIESRVWDSEIFHAVWRRDHDRATKILASDPTQATVCLADPTGKDGFYNGLPYCGLTPLHYAVIAGDEPMVRLLLQTGAKVDAVPHGHQSDSRHTPLYHVPDGCGDIAQLLVDNGANVRHSALYLSEGSKAMQQVVVANGAGGTPLLGALAIGDFERATQIVREDPSAIHDRLDDAAIDTPLHLAVNANSADVVKLLLRQGMNVDTPSSQGATALAMAPGMYCSFEMFELLVENGADVRVGDDSPLYAAVWQHAYGHWDYESVIRFLVGKGSQPRGLCHCAHGGNLALTKLLIELGANVNETDEFGFYSKRLSTSQGHTALDYCTGVVGDHEHPDIAEFLRGQGAKHKSEIGSD